MVGGLLVVALGLFEVDAGGGLIFSFLTSAGAVILLTIVNMVTGRSRS